MAVTLTKHMLMQPTGELSPHYFPQGDLLDLIVEWLPVAKAKVEADSSIADADHNRAAAAYVYYRAYDYIANQLAALPSSATEGSDAISVSWSASQIVHFRNLAAQKLAEFQSVRTANVVTPLFFSLAHGQRGR